MEESHDGVMTRAGMILEGERKRNNRYCNEGIIDAVLQ